MTRSSAAGLSDARGVRLGTGVRAAADHAEDALRHILTFADTPGPALAAARAADPGWALPALLEAGCHLASHFSGDRPAARALLDGVAPGIASAPPRERMHWRALVEQLEGRPQAAVRIWDEWLLETPRDALALHWAHQLDLAQGDVRSLRLRPARALPEWDDTDALFPCMLGLYAFGLAECQQFAAAEDLGRRALVLAEQAAAHDPARARVPAAVHAVTHAMELQGRFDEGAAWLRQQQARWADGSRFATHLWWHLALFRLEALDVAGTLRLIDTHLCGDTLAHPARCVDAASLYWRLRLMDVEVDALFKDLLRRWRPDPEAAGTHALTDWHVVLAMLGAGERAQADGWVARCAERLVRGDEGARAHQSIARELGLPMMRALLAADRGDYDAAVRGLYLVHDASARLGGTQVRGDLVAQTLMHCAARGGLAHVGRAVLNERCLAKTVTPLTRQWASRLGVALM